MEPPSEGEVTSKGKKKVREILLFKARNQYHWPKKRDFLSLEEGD
jgi:hypothetical protein